MWDYFVAKVSNAILEMSKIDDRDPWLMVCLRPSFTISLLSLFSPSQPFLPLSDSNALCDSDESGAEDDEDDDDAFLSDTQMTEHSDPNSYR